MGRLELHPTTLEYLRSLNARWTSVIFRIYDVPGLKFFRHALRSASGGRHLKSGNAGRVFNVNVSGWICELHFGNRHGHWTIDLVFPVNSYGRDVTPDAALLETVDKVRLELSRLQTGWAADHALGIQDLERFASMFRLNVDPTRLQ